MSAKVVNVESKPILSINGKYKIQFQLLKKSQSIITCNETFNEISYYIDIIPYPVHLCLFLLETRIFCNPTQNTIELCIRIHDATFYNSGIALVWREAAKKMTEENRRVYFLYRVPALASEG